MRALVTVKALLVPPATVTSAVSKPLTSSEKVKVAWNVAVELIFAGTPEIATVGATLSHVAVAVTSAAGVRFTPSVAASFGTVTTTFAPPAGVSTSV